MREGGLVKNEKWYSILGSYLKQYRMTALMFLLFSGIFAMVFSLYDLEMEAVLYATGLCLLLTIVVLSVHFFFYWKRHKERRRIEPFPKK